MPVSWAFQNSILVVTIVEEYEYREFIEALIQAYDNPEFTKTTAVLIDARQSRSTLSGADMQATKRTIIGRRPASHTGKWAMVTGPEPLRFGIGRMAALTMESMGVKAEVFTDLDAALKFLRPA